MMIDMAKTMPFITDWAMEDVTITSCPGGVSECEHSDTHGSFEDSEKPKMFQYLVADCGWERAITTPMPPKSFTISQLHGFCLSA